VRVQQLDLPAAFASLHSRPEGLTGAEARQRLTEYGPNRLRDVQRTPLVLRLLRQFTHAFALILWLAAGLAWFAAWQDPAGGMGALAAAIVGVICVNAAFSFWQEYRAERAIAALQRLLPDEITAIRDGRPARIAAAALVPGDVVHLEARDVVPADCRTGWPHGGPRRPDGDGARRGGAARHERNGRRPPRPPSTRLLTPGLLGRAYGFLGPLEAAAAMAAFFFVLRQGGWTSGEPLAREAPLYLQGTTACLAAIVMMQVVNVFNCRSARRSAFGFGLFTNRLILAGVALETALILFIVYTPSGNLLLGAARLPAAAWASMVPFAVALLVLEETRKWLARRA
jgi:magnesium-transporting ATPase (P-type)